MSANQFEICIHGKDVSPDTVEVEDLLSLLGKLVGAIRFAVPVTGKAGDAVSLRLVSIGEGSNRLTLAASSEGKRRAKLVTDAIATNDASRLTPKSRQFVRDAWQIISRKNGAWEWCSISGNGAAIGNAELRFDREVFVEPSRQFKGRTVLYGECRDAGGDVTFSALLRVLNGKKITVKVSQELAEQLGKRLFQVVGLDGEATWDAVSGEMIAFKADALTSFSDRTTDGKRRTVRMAFEDLAKAAGTRWDNIDPDAFVNELRRD